MPATLNATIGMFSTIKPCIQTYLIVSALQKIERKQILSIFVFCYYLCSTYGFVYASGKQHTVQNNVF